MINQNDTQAQLAELRARKEKVEEKRERLSVVLEQTEHELQRLEARRQYRRSAKDRTRTHRLIQYGAAMESNHRELSVLFDPEIYTLIENMLEVPGVEECIRSAVASHEGGHG